jgi:ABC-type multidrug transport system permease subunit
MLPIVGFYYISRLATMHTAHNKAGYFGFVVVGIMVLNSVECGVTVALNLRSELLAGTFERLVCSPFGAVNSIIASTIFPTALQLCISVVLLCFANAVFAMHVTWTTAPLAVPVTIAALCLFNALAVIGAAAVLVLKQATNGAFYAATALALLGGVYFPVALLPHWTHPITEIQPLTNLADLLRHYLIGYPLHTSLVAAVTRVAGSLMVLIPAAYLILYYAIRFTRRRATVLEY